MNFNTHFELEGRHAFLSPSQYHWLNYDDEKMQQVYFNMQARKRGTELHDLARRCIELGVKLPRSKKTLNMYVNDAIGYRMQPEQPLYYSEYCFGTADTISFEKDTLRIHDLKTGVTPAHMEQLAVYAALFCLEYDVRPGDISFELRIYQSDEIIVDEPTAEDIGPIVDRIVYFDRMLHQIEED